MKNENENVYLIKIAESLTLKKSAGAITSAIKGAARFVGNNALDAVGRPLKQKALDLGMNVSQASKVSANFKGIKGLVKHVEKTQGKKTFSSLDRREARREAVNKIRGLNKPQPLGTKNTDKGQMPHLKRQMINGKILTGATGVAAYMGLKKGVKAVVGGDSNDPYSYNYK